MVVGREFQAELLGRLHKDSSGFIAAVHGRGKVPETELAAPGANHAKAKRVKRADVERVLLDLADARHTLRAANIKRT